MGTFSSAASSESWPACSWVNDCGGRRDEQQTNRGQLKELCKDVWMAVNAKSIKEKQTRTEMARMLPFASWFSPDALSSVSLV
jgi:hypothetical protein